MRIWILAAAIGTALLLAPQVSATEELKYEIDEGDIYLGDTSNFSKPGIVDVDRVYGRIKEYRQIIERGIDESSPKYMILMRKASNKFRAAIQEASDDEGYDLIGAVGSIRPKGKSRKKIPDITKLVISKLP